MPTVKAVLKNDFVKSDGKCRIYFRIYHKKLRYIPSKYFIEPKYWDEKAGRAKPSYPSSGTLNKNIYWKLLEYTSIIEEQGEDIDDIGIDALVRKLTGIAGSKASFTRYCQNWTKELRESGRQSYAESNEVSHKLLSLYLESDNILFKEITPAVLNGFRDFLSLRGCKINTQRIYLNNIRTLFNNTIKKGEIKQSPFRNFEIRKEKVKQTALSVTEVKKLMAGPYFIAQQRSVNLFMLSFYFLGMNLKDLLFLPSGSIKDGYIAYKRLKIAEKQELDLRLKVIPEAWEIINQYKGERYLLKFMDPFDNNTDQGQKAYKIFLKETNKRLRMAGGYAGISKYLTIGITRHTWATIAMSKGVPASDVDLALGHNLNTILGGYISYDQLFNRVDDANEKVINQLNILPAPVISQSADTL